MAEFRIAPGGYVSPIEGTIADNSSGTFGAARSGGGRKHAGNDFQTPTGSPALAVVGGKVIYVGDNQGYRHNAVVLGDDGNAYRYATHKSIDVKLGQRVEQGQKIGTVGGLNGGRSHLHFEVIPPTSPAFRKMVANPGQFVSTQWFPGGPPLTTDPAKVLGVNYGDRLIAGKILPNPDPFGVDKFNQKAATATGFPAPPLPNLRPKEPYSVVRQRLTDMADAGRAAQRAPGGVPSFDTAEMAFAAPNLRPPAQNAIATSFPNVSKFGGAESLRAPTSYTPFTPNQSTSYTPFTPAPAPARPTTSYTPFTPAPPPPLAPQHVAASDTPLPNMRPRGFDARNVVEAYRTGGEPAVRNMVIASTFRDGGTAQQTYDLTTENEKKARAWITAAEAGAKLTEGGLSAGAAVQSTANDAVNAAKNFFSQFGGTKAPPPGGAAVSARPVAATGNTYPSQPPPMAATGYAYPSQPRPVAATGNTYQSQPRPMAATGNIRHRSRRKPHEHQPLLRRIMGRCPTTTWRPVISVPMAS